MIDAFRRFVEMRSFKYTSSAEQTLDELENIVMDGDAGSTELQGSLTELRRVLQRQHKKEYLKHRELFVARIGTEISAKLWGTVAFEKHQKQKSENVPKMTPKWTPN